MNSSENNVITGLQWGNEGKKKLTDFFANRSEAIVRFNGSSSGGHPINAGGESFTLDYLPCGIHHDGKLCVIAAGTALDLDKAADEIVALKNAGVLKARLHISERCPLILDFHKKQELLEARAMYRNMGWLMNERGYGAALSDIYGALGVTAGDLLHPLVLREKIKHVMKIKNELFFKVFNEAPVDPNAICDEILKKAEALLPYVSPVEGLIAKAVADNAGVLFEGCDGSMNDAQCGLYPSLAPGRRSAAEVFLSCGLRHNTSLRVIGAAKAYCAKSGDGPFITEEKSTVGAFLRARGGEFNELTGEQRRTGWLDLPALAYSVRANSADVLALTKLDALTGIDELKLCTAYRIDGKEVTAGDITAEEAARAVPVYETLEGWKEELQGCADFSRLPRQTQGYIRFIEEYVGLRVIWAGLGRQWGNALYASEER